MITRFNLSLIVGLALICSASFAETFTFDAVADAEIDSHSNYANNALGSAESFTIGPYPEAYTTDPNSYALIRWDLSSIPFDYTITDVTLEMTGQDWPNGGIDVYGITQGTWEESTVTWNSWDSTQKTLAWLGQLTSAGPASTQGATTYSHPNLTAIARQWAAGSQQNNGVFLKMSGSDRGNQDTFSSRETTWDYGHAPQLIITALPVIAGGTNTFDASADAEIDSHSNYAGNNLGSAEFFTVGPYDAAYTTDPNSYALIKWDLSSLHSSDTVTSVTLEMTGQDWPNGAINVYAVDEGYWAESTVTWNSWDATANKSLVLIGQLTSAGPASTQGATTFSSVDLTQWVQDWVSGTQANHGIFLEMSGADRGRQDTFSSKETTWDYGHAPQLIIAHESVKGNVQGTISIDSYNGDMSLVGMQIKLQQNGSDVITKTLMLDTAGSFAVSDVALGTYDVVIDIYSQLQKVISSVEMTGSSLNLGTINISNGDINKDGIVDDADLSILASGWLAGE